jgi:hypothetical protein
MHAVVRTYSGKGAMELMDVLKKTRPRWKDLFVQSKVL